MNVRLRCVWLLLLFVVACGPGPSATGPEDITPRPDDDDPPAELCDLRVTVDRHTRLIDFGRKVRVDVEGFDIGEDVELTFVEYLPKLPGWEPRTFVQTWDGEDRFRIRLPIGKWYVEASALVGGELCTSERDSLLVVGFEPGTECDYLLDRPGDGSAVANANELLRWRIVGELPKETVIEGFLGIHYLETEGYFWEPPLRVLQEAGVIAWTEFTLPFLGEYHYAPIFYTEEETPSGVIRRTRSFERLGITALRN